MGQRAENPRPVFTRSAIDERSGLASRQILKPARKHSLMMRLERSGLIIIVHPIIRLLGAGFDPFEKPLVWCIGFAASIMGNQV